MKKSYIVLCVVLAIVVLGVIYSVSAYNSLVDLKETVDAGESEIDNQLERRADLIPNLVNTVKGYVEHEEGIIKNITDARASLVGAKDMKDKAEANENLNKAIDALLVIVENYPDLKANQNFISLQDELAGTENRIANARRNYNDAVKEYNQSIKKFPKNIIANMFNFDKEEYFEVEESKKEVPNVEF